MSDAIFTETQVEGIKKAVNELLVCMAKINAEKQQIKDILDHVKEEYEVDKKYVRKVAQIIHQEKSHDLMVEHDILETMLNIVEDDLN